MRRILNCLLVVTLALGAAACGDDDDDASGATTTTGGTTETTEAGEAGDSDESDGNVVAITIANFAFVPADATAAAAAEVHFEVVNQDTTAHTFTIDGTDVDIAVAPGATEGRDTTLEAGDYEFSCRIHPSMTGTLTVA